MFNGSRIGMAVAAAAVLCGGTLLAGAPAGAGAQQAHATPDSARQANRTAAADSGVSDNLREFEARRRLGAGYFLTEAQLGREHDHPLGDILTMHIPGLRTVRGAHLNAEYLVSLRGEGPNALVSNAGASLCYVQIFVDGSFIVDGDISWLNPNDLAGVEFYDVTRTPPEYRRPNGQCGALLVWSRTGD